MRLGSITTHPSPRNSLGNGLKRANRLQRKRKYVTLSFNKVMVTVFWDARGIVIIDYLEKGKTITITGEFYAALLQRLSEKIKEKRPHLAKKKVLFHHDNAPAHTSTIAMSKINDKRFELLPHPAYSPDLAPCYYHSSQTSKNGSEDRNYRVTMK